MCTLYKKNIFFLRAKNIFFQVYHFSLDLCLQYGVIAIQKIRILYSQIYQSSIFSLGSFII